MTSADEITIKDVLTKQFLIKAGLFLLLFGLIFTAGYLMGKESSCQEAVTYSMEYAKETIMKYCPAAFISNDIVIFNSTNISWDVK